MEEYVPYKRPRLVDSLQPSASFMDLRNNMVPFGFLGSQEREPGPDMNMAAGMQPMPQGLAAALNQQSQDFGQLAAAVAAAGVVADWRHATDADTRHGFVNKFIWQINDLPCNFARVAALTRNVDGPASRSPKWLGTARKIEGKAYKAALSRAHYFDLMKEEIHKLQTGGLSYSTMSSQFFPSSSATSAAATAAANNVQLLNIPQNYGPNSFVTATQSQAGLAHSATSVNLFGADEVVSNPMRIPVTSSIGSARPQFDAFNGRQPRSMVHDQVPGSSLPLGDPTQFMPNAEPVLGSNLLHPMNAIITNPLGQYMPSSSVSGAPSQQRGFGLNDGQSVLSENSSIVNSQGSARLQKEWHKSAPFSFRNSLIRKMAQFFLTTPDPQTNTMESAIYVATRIENETYKTANSLSQYYDAMVQRCLLIAKERTPHGIQYYVPDIRRIYEALGIAYPHPTNQQPQFSSNNGGPSSNGRMHGNDVGAGVMPSLMGTGVAPPPPPFCAIARGQSMPQFAGHNQILGIDSNETSYSSILSEMGMPMSQDSVPEVIKQLAHAYKCQERENQENDVMLLCSLPNCRETKDLLNHITTCHVVGNCCGSTKEIIDHWNRCNLADCPICLPVRQAERNLNSTVVTASPNNQLTINPFMRRPHRSMGSSYPSTATSGLLSNQSQGGPSNGLGPRNDRISPRSSMWHSNYDSWRSSSGADMSIDNSGGGGVTGNRRMQPRFYMHNRNNSGNRHERRAPPYNNPWAAPEIIFVENNRQSSRGPSLFGPIASRNTDRLQGYGAPWRSPDVLFVENVRPAHRQPQVLTFVDSDEPVIIPSEEDATPSEQAQMMAIVKTLKSSGGRLEQKYRCSRRSCCALWPCLHRRLAASIQSLKTPIPG
ncbi:uncharacterized protein LOC131672527 isoform X2 [Phymastichus coffea]|uniref:uncharacterized protein LOC131672527 isoform X2 n=1 Tax=Phymastichus coffea TaxID=108790 RepID=UPI00273CE4FB|nr:uncharacterized protein LOC131672527 isoform X2 [Phymastichus coffea]